MIMRAKITATASSFLRMPACASFCWTTLTWLSCRTLSDDKVSRILSVVSVLRTRLARFLAVLVVIPALSCSRRSLSALTRLAIGSRTVIAA